MWNSPQSFASVRTDNPAITIFARGIAAEFTSTIPPASAPVGTCAHAPAAKTHATKTIRLISDLRITATPTDTIRLPGGTMAAAKRRTSVAVKIGGVWVGGNHPIVVQSMTNTDTADVASTVNQVMALAQAGSELVRVTVNTEEAARAVPKIADTLDKFGVRVPIIGDFHYNGHILLKKYPDCARALAKYRINPGNVNIGKKHDDNFRVMIEAAVEYDRPVRIGVNWGSLDQSLLTRMMDENSKLADPLDAKEVTLRAIVTSAVHSARAAEQYGLNRDHIILSAKVSGVQDLIRVYRI